MKILFIGNPASTMTPLATELKRRGHEPRIIRVFKNSPQRTYTNEDYSRIVFPLRMFLLSKSIKWADVIHLNGNNWKIYRILQRIWKHKIWVQMFHGSDLRTYGNTTFMNFKVQLCSTPDLIYTAEDLGTNVPIYLPHSIDINSLHVYKGNASNKPRVIHYSNLTKGTSRIKKAVINANLPLIIFGRDNKEISHEEFLKQLAIGDIVIGHWNPRFGNYCMIEVESMGSGLPVLSTIHPEYRMKYYHNCPILNLDQSTVDDCFNKLMNPKERLRLGRAGQEYVKKHHNKEHITNIWIKEVLE